MGIARVIVAFFGGLFLWESDLQLLPSPKRPKTSDSRASQGLGKTWSPRNRFLGLSCWEARETRQKGMTILVS